MHKKRSKKRSKWCMLRNLRKYQTDLKNNGVKMMVTTLAPRQAIFYVDATTPKRVQEQQSSKNAISVLLKGLEM